MIQSSYFRHDISIISEVIQVDGKLSCLLEHEIPLPVISEILGHTTTETTMAYLRIDISELRKCALEVAI